MRPFRPSPKRTAIPNLPLDKLQQHADLVTGRGRWAEAALLASEQAALARREELERQSCELYEIPLPEFPKENE